MDEFVNLGFLLKKIYLIEFTLGNYEGLCAKKNQL